MNALGIYKKLDCATDDKIIFYNEESGFYLFRTIQQENNWKVCFQKSFLSKTELRFIVPIDDISFVVTPPFCLLFQIANKSLEENAFIEFETCNDPSTSTLLNCTKGWKYLSTKEWKFDLTASIDCNGS